jgi:hypothetical protein
VEQTSWYASFFSAADGVVSQDSFGVLSRVGDDLFLLDRSSVRLAARSVQRFENICFGDLIRIANFWIRVGPISSSVSTDWFQKRLAVHRSSRPTSGLTGGISTRPHSVQP